MNHQPDDGSNNFLLLSTRIDGEISQKTAIFYSNNSLQFLDQMNDYQLLTKDCVKKRMNVKVLQQMLNLQFVCNGYIYDHSKCSV
jgi:hypothetical protein